MDDVINFIKLIFPQILPVASLLLGMWIQSSIDNKKDSKNYIRKKREAEIEELKNYFKHFMRYYKKITAQQIGYDFFLSNQMTYDRFLAATSDKRYDDFDLEYMMLIQRLYFKTTNFEKLQENIFELTQIWMQNTPMINFDEYKKMCFFVINGCVKHQREIVDLIKLKQDELLSMK